MELRARPIINLALYYSALLCTILHHFIPFYTTLYYLAPLCTIFYIILHYSVLFELVYTWLINEEGVASC
jgi:hypothetical protein